MLRINQQNTLLGASGKTQDTCVNNKNSTDNKLEEIYDKNESKKIQEQPTREQSSNKLEARRLILLNNNSSLFDKKLTELKIVAEEIQILRYLQQFLEWDLHTAMPSKAADSRASQMSFLKDLEHKRLISNELAELLEFFKKEDHLNKLTIVEQALVRELDKEHTKFKKISTSLVKELVETTAKAHHVWVEAKKKNNFNLFAPYLEKIISIRKEMAKCIGYKDSPYNALLELYEYGMDTKQLDLVFSKLKEALVPIIKQIKESNTYISNDNDNSILQKEAPCKDLYELSKEVLNVMRFDLLRGRLSSSPHPFSTIISENDIGLTSRFKNIWDAISTATHEGGHGLYDQGIDTNLGKTILFEGTSLGIHESQSRLYEVIIGQGLPFWKYFYPKLQERFPEVFKDIKLENFYKAVNKVTPQVIRNESDEVTYNLHVIVRYEIEKDLIEGKLEVKDIPKVWKEKTENYVGVKVDSDSNGPLQDVHWSCGDLGYFPTYTLGNLYAVQFYNTAKKEIPNLEKEIENGNLLLLRDWLKEKIHKYGKTETAEQILKRVTGESLNPQHFINYIKDKYSKIYNIEIT